MDGILQVAVLLAGIVAADTGAAPVDAFVAADSAAASLDALDMRSPSDPWTSEDKFRHVAASWAAMVFTYAAVRSVNDDSDTALAIALPVTAAFGVAKEVVDRRRGGPFSFRDLAADALGSGVAWLFLREVH